MNDDRPDRSYSRLFADVSEEEREEANESIRLAMLDTSPGHPEHAAVIESACTLKP